MDFAFTPTEEAFRQELRTWLEANLPDGWLEGNRSLPEDENEYKAFLKDWQKTLYEGGWAAIAWSKEYGGRNASLVEEIIYHQEMARVSAPPSVNYVGLHMVAPTLMQIGTDEQKEKYIHKILTGEEIWCQGYSEPNAGSDLSAISTKAEKIGDKWVINGQKVWTSFGHFADRCFLLARTSNNSEKRHKGITVFLLDMHQKGVETVPIISMDGEKDFNEVYLNDAIASDADIVGRVDEGWSVMISLLMHERTGIGAQLFTLEQQFTDLVRLAKSFALDGEAVSKNPEIRQKLASLYAKSKGALLNYYRHLTDTLKNGQPGPESAMDKLIVSELTQELLSLAVSMQGGQSVLWKEDAAVSPFWQKQYLYSFGMTIGGGTSEIQRNTIGERVLGLPKDLGR